MRPLEFGPELATTNQTQFSWLKEDKYVLKEKEHTIKIHFLNTRACNSMKEYSIYRTAIAHNKLTYYYLSNPTILTIINLIN